MLRSILAVMLLILLCGVATAAELKRLSLDDASTLGTTIRTDTAVKTEGLGAIRIDTKTPTTVCLGEVTGLDVDQARLVYKARVKSDLVGSAWLEMWVAVNGGNYFSKGLEHPAKGKMDWTLLQTPFYLQKGQKAQKAILNLVIDGTGTVWVDDALLAREPLP